MNSGGWKEKKSTWIWEGRSGEGVGEGRGQGMGILKQNPLYTYVKYSISQSINIKKNAVPREKSMEEKGSTVQKLTEN